MKAKFEWTKTFVYGDDDHQQECLVNVLRNILWQHQFYSRGQIQIYSLAQIHRFAGRDVYYIVVGEFDRYKLDNAHLDKWEQEQITKVSVDDVLLRINNVPDWWAHKWNS